MRSPLAPRLVDWWILATVLVAAGTGLGSVLAGRPGDAWVFVVHGVAGVTLAVLLALKLARVYPRLKKPSGRRASTAVSAVVTVLALAAVATGVFWVSGGDFRLIAWNALTVHTLIGLLLVPVLVVHLRHRLRWAQRPAFTERRAALGSLGLVVGGILVWRAHGLAVSALGWRGANRRFTGSREQAGPAGNDFPVTSWVADDPAPVDANAWRLAVGGAVDRSVELDLEEADAVGDVLTATLDCTGGWYAQREWAGVRVGRLLDRAGADPRARWVRFESVTGYRWSLPVGEAREALLATRVGDEALTHGHGAPIRLVAPGRRGFQWVKWVTEVEVRRRPDYGQWIAVFTSGFR